MTREESDRTVDRVIATLDIGTTRVLDAGRFVLEV